MEIVQAWGVRLRTLAAVGGISLALSGCVAAALVPLAAETGLVGLSAYKLVQVEGGGSVGVNFAAGPDRKVPAPTPITAVSRVAVWPGDASNVRFAEKLGQSGHLKAIGPATVAARLTDVRIPADLNQVTDTERDEAFVVVCKRFGVDMVFAERGLGTTQNENIFSLSRANVTSTIDLLGFSCAKRSVVWKDRMSLVVQVGASHIPTNNELAEVAGDAWAERVLTAMGYPAPAKPLDGAKS